MKRKTYYYVDSCDDANAKPAVFTRINKARKFAISQSEQMIEKDWMIERLVVFKSKFSSQYITQEGKTKPSGIQRCTLAELHEYSEELEKRFTEQRKEFS